MVKGISNNVIICWSITMCMGCSGVKMGVRQKVYQGLTIYATDWKKHTFRPLTFSAMHSEQNFCFFDILEATGRLELIEAVSFPKEWYSLKD
ncbi:MAG: hypothetical protein ACK4WD_10880 [Flavobacteriales bacterium]|jgi:hypothetical protein